MRRFVAAVAVAGVALGLSGSWHAVVSGAATICQPGQPAVAQVTPASAPLGAVITVAGQNLAAVSPNGCSVAVVVEDATQAQPAYPQFTPSDDNGSSLHFTLTAPASGPLRVVITGPDGSIESPQSINVFTNPTAGTLPSSPRIGDPLKVAGAGLQLGGQEAGAALSYTPIAGHCPAPPASAAFTNSEVDLPPLSSYCQMSVALSLTPWADTAHTTQSPALSLSLGTIDVAPTLSNGDLQNRHVTAGATLSLTGTGLGFSGSASVGGENTTVTLSDTAVSIHVPDDAVNNASVTATRADGVQLPVSGGIDVDARVDAISPSSAAVGDAVTITGGGFGHTPGTVSIGSATFPVRSWSPTSITLTVPPGAPSGVPGIQPKDTGAPASAPSLTVLPRITGVTPGHAAPGAAFEVVGTSFGPPQTGDSVSVGSVAATVSLWSDTQIVAAIPAGLPAGATSVAVSVAGAQGPITTAITIDPATGTSGVPSAESGSAAQSTPGPTPGIVAPAPGGPIVTRNPASFQRPVPQPGAPVTVTLSATSTETDPGRQVPLTATVIAFGKPAVGVSVSFLLVVVPGGDAGLSQPSAVTDQQGKASVLLRLSRTAGDTIVLARAGQYQDEIRIVGRGPAAAITAASASTGDSGGGSTALGAAGGSPQRLLIVGLLVVCLALFLSGFAIQLRSSAHGDTAAATSLRRSRSGDRVLEATRAGGAVLQFAAAMGVAMVGRIVGRVRRWS